ncbi:MAG TPA: PadR family transcriptional regulator [Acidobacteriaceae bacterium]|jgi:DNA-binding PadR family transcriptional regulator|nr:PadR family transcriptional regulator [Acidobacteriaceae bacterium]
MFYQYFSRESEGRGSFEHGGHRCGKHGERHGERGFRGGRGEFGFRGGREHGFGGAARMFDAGDIRLVVLKLLSEQPSYGYQLMKTMEERLGGGYTPSAGVIYPTLTMLEEEGLASVTVSEGNRKVYSATQAGLESLEAQKERIAELFERLDETGRGFRRGRSPEIMKSMMNLRGAVIARVARGNATAEQIGRITEAIDAAAKAIDEL